MLVSPRKLLSLLIPFCMGAAYANTASDSVRIYGNAPEYAGITLVLEHTTNFISREKEELVRVAIDKNGNFNQTFEVKNTLSCFSDLGKYRAYMYVEPDQSYQIVLPPFAPRPQADRFNPYFIPESIEIGIVSNNSSTLNQQIRDFDESFDALYNQHAISIFAKTDIAKTNQIIAKIDSAYPTLNNPNFDLHKKASYFRLYNLAYKRQRLLLMQNFVAQLPVSFSMPAYTHAFNDIFKDFFLFYFSTANGKKIRDNFQSMTSFDTLSIAMREDSLFENNELREAVLIKSLYDGYYSDRYDKQQIEKLVESAASVGTSKQIQALANGLLQKFRKLKKGTLAPDFVGYSSSGKAYALTSFKGKFVYLTFAHTQNYACKKDLIALTALARELKKDLEVVTILTDEDADAAFRYTKQNNLKYNLLHFGGNGKILLDYDIKALPSYYLIDPEGNISLSTAPAPGESFTKIFQEALRNFKYSKARKSDDLQRSIYDL